MTRKSDTRVRGINEAETEASVSSVGRPRS